MRRTLHSEGQGWSWRRRLSRGLITGIAALALWPNALAASLIIPADLIELAGEARAIVHGRITNIDTRWVTGRRRIESVVTMIVLGYFKGDLGPTVTFRTPGGRLGAYRTVVIGAPVVSVGQEVVVFLGASGPSIPYVLRLSQGVFRVVPERWTGRRVVVPPLIGPPERGSQRLIRGDRTRRPVPFETFSARVREIVAELATRGAVE